MPLQPGTTLGPYAVTAKIGEGGMGEVYRARDTTLDRDVAIKVLPDAFASDPERLARFEREAKVLASLNHPNIGAIYGLEKSGDTRALVLELVEGPTLADRIKQGPIPLDEALPIAKQIAEALEAAHEAGVIHRDLKPANIKVRDDGMVKVLDFGLAKALDPSPDADPSQSPTLTAMATQMGVIMGTAAYMSPEQARGSAADHRSDIWSFGVVLYEMVTGKGMFDGATVSDVLAAVLRSDPLWEQLPRDLPPGVRRLLKRCVERDRKERLQHIGDARVELRDAISSPLADASVMATPTRGWQGRWALATMLLLVATAAGLRVWTFPRANPTELLPTPIALTPPTNASVFADLGFAVSPNGRTVVFVGTDGQLYQRSLSELDPVLVPGTSDAYQPFFSPDGSWLAYIDRGDDTLKKLRLDGSERVTLCPVPNALRSTSWGPDDNIVFSYLGASSLWRVSANGGDPEPIPTDNTSNEAWDERTLLRWVDVLPTGTAVLASVGAPATQQEIVVVSLENGQKKVLLRGATPRYLATGHIVYWRDSCTGQRLGALRRRWWHVGVQNRHSSDGNDTCLG